MEGRDHRRNGRGVLPGSSEEPLWQIAPIETRVGLRLHDPSEVPIWAIEFVTRVVDNQDRVASSLEEQPSSGFTTYDLRGYWQATETFLLLAGVENITDKHYREHLDLRTGRGVFQPGRNFYVGAEFRF